MLTRQDVDTRNHDAHMHDIHRLLLDATFRSIVLRAVERHFTDTQTR